jgi:hypothetical protein
MGAKDENKLICWPGWKKYRTTEPLVPEIFSVPRKYFPKKEKNCREEWENCQRKIHTMNSEMQL